MFAKYIITISANNGSLCYEFLNTFVVIFTFEVIDPIKKEIYFVSINFEIVFLPDEI